MRYLLSLIVAVAVSHGAFARPPEPQPLEDLLERYRSAVPAQPRAEVRLDGWIEERTGGGHEVVIVLTPKGETKLNADPGIMVTPARPAEVRWHVPVPFHHVDTSVPYFEPNATLRMPFDGDLGEPIVVLVEFAYCVVDFQCFFGEQELTVAAID